MNNDELQQNGEQKQPNLLTRTWQRLKTKLHGTKIAKRVGALVIAAAMAVSLSACNPTVTPDPGGDVKIVCPECGGNHTKDQHQNNQKSYSVLLHHVVENPSYNATLNELKEYNDYYHTLTPNQQEAFDKENPRAKYKFNNHPYAFLADKGFDVNAIKNGECLCVSRVMFDESQPTKVYITVSVSNPKTGGRVIFGKGVTQYMLAYTLTKQEVNEYKALLKSHSPIALFYPDAIAKLKKPEILLESHIHEDTYEKLRETLYRRNDQSYHWGSSPTIKPLRLVDGFANDVLLKSYDLDNQTFDLIVVGEDSIADYRGQCINSEKLSFYHEDGISLKVPGMYYFHWTEADDFVQKKARPMTVYGTQIRGDKFFDFHSFVWRNDSNFGPVGFYAPNDHDLDPDNIYQIVDEYMLEASTK